LLIGRIASGRASCIDDEVFSFQAALPDDRHCRCGGGGDFSGNFYDPAKIDKSVKEKKPVSVGLVGNAAEILPELIRVQLSFVKGDTRHWPDLIVAPQLAAPES
jgi:hypothetical protein